MRAGRLFRYEAFGSETLESCSFNGTLSSVNVGPMTLAVTLA
jgi:hypothetical protein